MEPPFDLIIDGVIEDEVLLNINLLQMASLAHLFWSIDLVVCLYPKSMRTHFELA
jgi:hypothetical protein